jgi:cytidylate kinase
MAIITISRGSYSKGKEVAEKVAARLRYQCIAREVLLEASKEFDVSEVAMLQALSDAPTIMERLTYRKEKIVVFFQAALLKHLQRDNVVYHGLAGHFFIRGVSHGLKVRIIADMEDRVRLEVEREGVSEEEALAAIKKRDEARRKWSRHLYGIDTWDSSLYDLVIRVRKITVDDAVDIICHTAGLGTFRTTPKSQNDMDDLVIGAQVKASLIALKPDVQVICKDGNVVVGTKSTLVQEDELFGQMVASAKEIQGVKSVEVKTTHLVHWQD